MNKKEDHVSRISDDLTSYSPLSYSLMDKEDKILLNSPVCGIVINTHKLSKPKKPEDDLNEVFIWIVKSHFDKYLEELQEKGYVYASNAYANYLYLRKPCIT